MADPDTGHITRLLQRVEVDQDEAFCAVLPLVVAELRDIARYQLRQERPDHTLQPTALVHEAYLKLAQQSAGSEIRNRRHFLAVASRAMRQILVDHARRHRAAKRGGEAFRITLDEGVLHDASEATDLEALHEALTVLEKLDPRRSRVVEMRFFGGMTNKEAAEVLGISPKTAEADWYFARAWLRRALAEDETA